MGIDKNFRLLYLMEDLLNGKKIPKKDAAERFGVDERSIQRDFKVLKDYFDENGSSVKLRYNQQKNVYELVNQECGFLTCGEMLAVCKILLESRSLPKDEMDAILKKLLVSCVSSKEKKKFDQILGNEKDFYVGPRHGKDLTELIWTLGEAVQKHSYIQITYHIQTGQTKLRRLRPVGLMFSEYYFYLMAFIENIDRTEHFENTSDRSPTIYRLDRIESIQVLNETFTVNGKDCFQEGEFRKRVQFMYGGKLQVVRFRYTGPCVDAVLDRLPTAKVISQDDEGCIIRAEVFGDGIEMWLRSQGSYVKMIE